ncbi:MAG TPA: DUF3846 domain-containing protein [Methylomusa anaerophila]|uniref:DUF3846 domain-containing protein n=1 Tax=Methylomusa anaerophila TaxID=1930071 RepID=A0A348ALH4_9FIRM|nr:DUF3846 domain-containing protein [Methylomusa anaerophila]BBB91922.1 hypothetical protein MAMMFC1_02607 [Methylomusa anaerophila]HML88064.1 DUF3846 domain-containing protein [Methylomusa anaerophila]
MRYINDDILVAVKKPSKLPVLQYIPNDTRSIQDIVGDPMKYINFQNDIMIVAYNNEGKPRDLPVNFEYNNDVIVGTCFFVGNIGGFSSLTEEQIGTVLNKFG